MKNILVLLLALCTFFGTSQTHQDCLNSGFNVFSNYSGGASGVCVWEDDNGNLFCSWGNSSINWQMTCINNCPNAIYYFGTGNAGKNYCENVIIPLPITLVSFEVKNYKDVNIIRWVTESEQNNNFFTIQHSINGEEWENITYIQSVGNSTVKIFYEYNHYNFTKEINYYRLQQTDFDGTTEIFEIISVDNRDEKKVLRTINMLGQEVDENYKGIFIIQYSDGTFEKKYIPN